jgi:phage gpG-like protein
MINVEIKAMLPDFSKFEFANSFEKVARNLELSIKTNFSAGGRPSNWAAKKNGEPSHLFKSGRLFQSITSGFGESYAESGVETGNVLPYTFAHQFGYAPKNLVARPFVLFQDEDKEMAIDVLRTDILTFWETQSEAVV